MILEPTNIQRHVKNVIEQLENTAPEGYDVPHPEKAWKPSRHGKVCINEGTSRKVRMIEKPRYNYEQVIHHIVVSACYDIFMKGMYEFSCGSVPNRGCSLWEKVHREVDSARQKELQICSQDGYSTLFRER